MTFLQEEDVFPSLTDSEASVKLEDGSNLDNSAASTKEEANITNVVGEVKRDGKRKLSDNKDDKKVPLPVSSCVFRRHPFYIFVTLR